MCGFDDHRSQTVPDEEGIETTPLRANPCCTRGPSGHAPVRTMDLTVEPNDVIDLEIEGDRARRIRLVGSAMPRLEAF